MATKVKIPKVKPPEWWTAENTAAWIREIWGNPKDWLVAMQTWGSKMDGAARASAACYRPLSAKELVEMRAKDSRPANAYYYDGAPILAYKPLAIKRAKREAAA
jgi:hypothetical protein